MGSSMKRRGVSLAAALALVASLSATDGFARDVKTITEVEVQEEQGMTRIILRGATDPIYTAFLREDPPRLIIELPDVMFDGVETPIRIDNDVVKDVTLAAFGDPQVSSSMARISVGLAAVLAGLPDSVRDRRRVHEGTLYDRLGRQRCVPESRQLVSTRGWLQLDNLDGARANIETYDGFGLEEHSSLSAQGFVSRGALHSDRSESLLWLRAAKDRLLVGDLQAQGMEDLAFGIEPAGLSRLDPVDGQR